jgi:hypothetical protein
MEQILIQLKPIGQQNLLIGGKHFLNWMRAGFGVLARICLSTLNILFGRCEFDEKIQEAKLKAMSLSMKF